MQGFLPGFLFCGVGGVAFLPPKFPRAQEGAGGLFPADHAAPLVIELGQIPPGLDDMGIVFAKQRFGGGAHAKTLLQPFGAAVGDPGHLRRKAFHMVLFLIQQRLWDKQRHSHIFMAAFFDHTVKDFLDILPDGLGIWPHDDAAPHAGIIDHLGFFDDICIPLGEIFVHGRDFAHELFVVCHCLFLFHPICPLASPPARGTNKYISLWALLQVRGVFFAPLSRGRPVGRRNPGSKRRPEGPNAAKPAG